MLSLDVLLAKQIQTACEDTKGSGRHWESVVGWGRWKDSNYSNHLRRGYSKAFYNCWVMHEVNNFNWPLKNFFSRMKTNFAFYPLGEWKVLITPPLNSRQPNLFQYPSLKMKKTSDYQRLMSSSEYLFYLGEWSLDSVLMLVFCFAFFLSPFPPDPMSAKISFQDFEKLTVRKIHLW